MHRVALALLAATACGRVSFGEIDDARDDGDAGVSDVADVPNRVFITATQTACTFGGIAAADDICARRYRWR